MTRDMTIMFALMFNDNFDLSQLSWHGKEVEFPADHIYPSTEGPTEDNDG